MRYRSWIIALVLVAAVMLTAVLAGHRDRGLVLGRPRVRFGAALQPPRADAGLRLTNGWSASAGRESVAVYAGSERAHPAVGLILIVRDTAGATSVRRVLLPGSGALTLLPPPPPTAEAAALAATLRFVTANGATGTLALTDDRATLNP